MSKPLRVAVTGVGGASGQGIIKALESSLLDVEVIPVDVLPTSAGLYMFRNQGVVLPRPEVNIDAWEKWAVDNKINCIIPGADRDLLPLAQVRTSWYDDYKIHVLANHIEAVKVANDKAATIRALDEHNIPTPDTVLQYDPHAPYKFPVVIKPRFDASSRGVQICRNHEELAFYWSRTHAPLIQEYLEGPEFTCSVFVNKWNELCAMHMMRRELWGGSTYRAQAGWWPELEPYLKAIARAVRPRGILNVQLRLTQDGPRVLELNARCSGSTAIRAMFGYNEPEMLINHFVLGKAVFQPKAQQGIVVRYFAEQRVMTDNPRWMDETFVDEGVSV